MASDHQQHTIVLIQFDQGKETRTYIDHETVPRALDGVCQIYEQSLKVMYPQLKSVTYDISDLFGYIDGLGDLCCFVYTPQMKAYIPHNREWIKMRVFEHLKAQVA
eukprot:TRINITY_DN49926_c0_g1_i1.p2 TRINITY_DN49926_c0_g1~~TRINITY_DN49926_c0_g1_i1.p2  ORF type:complete len:122 (-),score=19.12 TRINITY_DN49926_c0_g1_i1:199-516(-)